MKITRIDCHVLLLQDYDASACSSAQDDLVVEVHTDAGLVGVGETDVNPWIARECIRARGTHCMGLGLSEMLIGADPLQPEALWRKLYAGSKMNGRRGALICALGALDMALWDLRGQALGVPIHTLLGGASQERITPYASLLPTGGGLQEYGDSLVAKLLQAQALGFRAAKLEVCINGPYSHGGLQAPDVEIERIVDRCRSAVGGDMTLMVDVAYAWSDAKRTLQQLERLSRYDLFFVETPLDIDDVAGHAFLRAHSPVRIAAGEWQNTHFEFLDLVDRGCLDVLQPDVGRVEEFTEAQKVCQLAADRGLLIVPHCWKSGVGIAASMHLAAANPCCPFFEYLPAELADSTLRRELTLGEPALEDGAFLPPEKPGLGVQLNRPALQRFRVEP